MVLIFLNTLGSVSLAAEPENCDVYNKRFQNTTESLAKLNEKNKALKMLLEGRLEAASVAVDFLPVLPSTQEALFQRQLQLREQRQRAKQEISAPADLSGCGVSEQAWLQIMQSERQAGQQNAGYLETIMLKAEKYPGAFKSVLDTLQELSEIKQALVANDQTNNESASAENNLAELNQILTNYVGDQQARLYDWWLYLVNDVEKLQQTDEFWLKSLQADLKPEWRDEPQSSITAMLDTYVLIWERLQELDQLISQQMIGWRNQVVLDSGLSGVAKQLMSPAQFFSSFYYELKAVPGNLWFLISHPYVQAYKEASKTDSVASLLSVWGAQLLALFVLISVLIRLASHATSWLADLQHRMMDRMESATGNSLVSGLFWMLKPNASWVFILLIAQLSRTIIPQDWLVLSLLAPMATLYAGFRALRVIIEWCFSRTYTRSGLFLSNQMAEMLIRDSQHMTWITVYLVISWCIAYATGGGYLLYVVSLVDLFILFGVSWWLLHKHSAAVDKLSLQVFGFKLNVEEGERHWLLIRLGKAAWPIMFVVLQFMDVLFSINQKLMVFDVYRSLSVKLLRVRLDSKAEEADENDEAEPDQNYSDWMLRHAPDNLLFDVGDVSGLLSPIKQWYAEKTDENLMVVIGESGSGKSTLIRRLPGLWSDTPVKVLDVKPKTTEPQVIFDQIAQALEIESFTDVGGLVRQDEKIKPQVLVIDSAHNLFLAEVGQLKAYKALLECMNAHIQNVFWMVVMHSPSWNYLNCVYAREQRISNVFKMPRWSPMDIRKLILSRHQGGRRRLKYNEMLLSAAASSESSSVRAADSRVFNILWEQCGGNPLAAIELWLNAVKVKGRVAEVGVPQRPASNLLNGLKDDLFFVYTAIVVHSELSTSEIMQVTHFSEPVVRHALKQGINLGMIIRDDSKRYKVDPYWYGTLSGYLHRKNMLWD